MKRRIVGRAAGQLGCGSISMSLGYAAPLREKYAAAPFVRALDLSLVHLDTAYIYGFGHKDEVIERALKGRGNEFLLALKIGIASEGQKRGIHCWMDATAAMLKPSWRRSRPVMPVYPTCTVSARRCR